MKSPTTAIALFVLAPLIAGAGILSNIQDRLNERTENITDSSSRLSSTAPLDTDSDDQPGPAEAIVGAVKAPIQDGISELTPTRAAPMTKSGFLPSYEGFKEDPDTGAWVWTDKPAPLAAYEKFAIAPIVVYPAKDAQFQAVSPDDLKKLTDYFRYELTKALEAQGFSVVTEGGEGVAVLRIAIVNVVPGNPVKYAGSFFPYARIVDGVKSATGEANMGVGTISIEAEAIDSATGEPVAAVIDTLAGKKLDVRQSLNKWGDIAQAIDTWAQRFAARVSQAHGAKE
ncbi:DUF3313 domain-containing protein [Cerasicoccus fimbriatus]|uniref:DUF3313 domain-containing protein n=1 Tax=Cerasicoccus fimbriatus TaxID=3014554 RepID=UPI0022B355A6|nr:DUF3313 domain-containing protein [Cerasicoccus sp. TK19100]